MRIAGTVRWGSTPRRARESCRKRACLFLRLPEHASFALSSFSQPTRARGTCPRARAASWPSSSENRRAPVHLSFLKTGCDLLGTQVDGWLRPEGATFSGDRRRTQLIVYLFYLQKRVSRSHSPNAKRTNHQLLAASQGQVVWRQADPRRGGRPDRRRARRGVASLGTARGSPRRPHCQANSATHTAARRKGG